MDDIESRYAPLIAQIAEMYAGHKGVDAQLRSLKVTREEWDADRRGGHFWFTVSAPVAGHDFLIDACAQDVDGAKIDIILHSVGGLLNWGEWYRLEVSPDRRELPIERWPPSAATPT